MIKTSKKIQLFLSLLAIALATLACSLTAQSPDSVGTLDVTLEAPPAEIEQGRAFDVVLSLANSSQYNVRVTEIRLPAAFLEGATYLGSDPALTLSSTTSGDGVIAMDLTIAPAGLERFTFRFEASQTGSLAGVGSVTTDSGAYDFDMQVTIAGLNPPGWAPGNASTATPPMLGDVPYQAVVQIKAIIEVDGQDEVGWSGSGTIISADGLILTNAHVVLSDRFYEVKDLIVALTVAQDVPPVDTYYASIVQADAYLDIAVIKPRSNMQGNPIDYTSLNLPFVPLGDSDNLLLGDEIVILGYPTIGGDTITLTRGEVSGFTSEETYGNRAFIKTSATIAGGNSGGLAVNQAGQLIGVPTYMGSGNDNTDIVDCRRLADTNRDGYIDENDTCVPTGGFINALRPINLALPLVEAARAGEVSIVAGTAEGETYQATGQLIFEDDFSDTDSGWAISTSTEGVTDYENGEYTIEVLTTDYLIWSDLDYAYDNLMLEADARVLQNTGDSDFGFICGVTDDSHFTVLEISEDGYFTIWKQLGDDYQYLVDWTYAEELAAGGPYNLNATCGTGGLALAVNGSLLAEIADPQFTPGQVGLIAGTYSHPNFKVAFDNFKLFLPE